MIALIILVNLLVTSSRASISASIGRLVIKSRHSVDKGTFGVGMGTMLL